jgi:hypothetical protein
MSAEEQQQQAEAKEAAEDQRRSMLVALLQPAARDRRRFFNSFFGFRYDIGHICIFMGVLCFSIFSLILSLKHIKFFLPSQSLA